MPTEEEKPPPNSTRTSRGARNARSRSGKTRIKQAMEYPEISTRDQRMLVECQIGEGKWKKKKKREKERNEEGEGEEKKRKGARNR